MVAFALAVSLWGAAPETASAQINETVVLVAALPVGAAGVTFLVADLVYVGLGRPMPVGWAVPQLIAGSVQLAFGVTSFALLPDTVYNTELLIAWGALGVGMGAFQLAYAIWSLVVGQEPRPQESPAIDVALTPTVGGAAAMISGRF